ncbi:unnamed protein product [Caenorhabditis angaria]|uniref:Tyrosine-protein kinase n=1 Tax=Caenorhabditis angaria TaxID=860376 RepID=A0A9P1MWH2_9PELO|nr:unnamed protein product [Caenorhabditis angaria]
MESQRTENKSLAKNEIHVQFQEFGQKTRKGRLSERENQECVVVIEQSSTVTAPTISYATGNKLASLDIQSDDSFMCQSMEDKQFESEYIKNKLQFYPWYWGMILSTKMDNVLKWNNSFVVRRSIDRLQNKLFIITMKRNNIIEHYEICRKYQTWSVPKLLDENQHFYDIPELINMLSKTLQGGTIPISRPPTIIYHDNIKMGKVLGKGAFGDVSQAIITLPGGEIRECAVKMIRGDSTRTQIAEFYQEVHIMELFDSPYVVKLYGTACLLTPVMVAMELLPGGSVWNYLRKNENVSHGKMFEMASDIAKGMAHLSDCQVIHRDLAARNCLLTADHRVKISDFGLSVQATQVIVKKLKQAPIRWLSPETLTKGIFNEKTDVWSYGVVLWEIFTKCANPPLHPKTQKESIVVIKEVENPHKLEDEKEVNEIIAVCCKKNSSDRPNFEKIIKLWEPMLNNTKVLYKILKKPLPKDNCLSTEEKVEKTEKSKNTKGKKRSKFFSGRQ